MGMKVKETGGGDFTPAPAGLHTAVCVSYIDLGEQAGVWEGKPTRKQKVVVTWELAGHTVEADGKEMPMTACNFYTKSLRDGSNLRKDLEGWRSREFTQAELDGFDLDNILGKPCQLNIIPYTKKDGKKSTKVAAVLPLSKGMVVPQPSITPWRYSIEEDGYHFPAELSDGFKKLIQKSSEFTVVNDLPGNPYGEQEQSTMEQLQDDIDSNPSLDDSDDSIPF